MINNLVARLDCRRQPPLELIIYILLKKKKTKTNPQRSRKVQGLALSHKAESDRGTHSNSGPRTATDF